MQFDLFGVKMYVLQIYKIKIKNLMCTYYYILHDFFKIVYVHPFIQFLFIVNNCLLP